MRNGKRIPFGMRVTQELRGKVEKAAAANGRSLSGEIEYRLERSFWIDEIQVDPPAASVGPINVELVGIEKIQG